MANEINTVSLINTDSSPVFRRRNDSRYLEVTLNGHKLPMKIDSGCHSSIVNKCVWEQLNQPPLQPTIKRFTATGAELPLKGQFVATVQFGQRVYQLPVQVSDLPDTRNLIGRNWFPSLHLNWNKIFYSKEKNISIFQKQSKKQDRLASKVVHNRSKFFRIDMKVEGKNLTMILDTGATLSQISNQTWKELGEPPLKPTNGITVDTANQQIFFNGECSVRVEYKGQKVLVPLLVNQEEVGQSVIGNHWCRYIQFDLNTIFADIMF